MSLESVYSSLWEIMNRDFESQLDSDTLDGFKQNVNRWAGEHQSDAVDAVAVEIWQELHEDEPIEEIETGVKIDAKGMLHNRGRFTSFNTDLAGIVAQNLNDDVLEESISALVQETKRLEREARTRKPEGPSAFESLRKVLGEVSIGPTETELERSVFGPPSEEEKAEIRKEKAKRDSRGRFVKR